MARKLVSEGRLRRLAEDKQWRAVVRGHLCFCATELRFCLCWTWLFSLENECRPSSINLFFLRSLSFPESKQVNAEIKILCLKNPENSCQKKQQRRSDLSSHRLVCYHRLTTSSWRVLRKLVNASKSAIFFSTESTKSVALTCRTGRRRNCAHILASSTFLNTT